MIKKTSKISKVSALDSRIKSGKADPITATERKLVAELRAGYEKKFGKKSGSSRVRPE